MTNDHCLQRSVPPAHPHRRRWLAGAGLWAALWLAGCSTPRRERVAPGSAARPAAAPLALDPAGREGAVAQALLLVNTPYTYGGNTPAGGFDCSGLVQYVMTHGAQGLAGARRLPRSTAQWAAASTPVAAGALQRGDLVFFNTSGAPWSHMGLYLGDGQFVHAPSSGGVVRINRLSDRYFARRFMGARTVFAR